MYRSKSVLRFSQICMLIHRLTTGVSLKGGEGSAMFRCEQETLSRKVMGLRTGKWTRNWSMFHSSARCLFLALMFFPIGLEDRHMQLAVLILKYPLIPWQILLSHKFLNKINISMEICDCIEINKQRAFKGNTACAVFFFPSEVCEEGVTSCWGNCNREVLGGFQEE